MRNLTQKTRGFTLIELMISSAISIVVILAAGAVLVTAGRLSHNSELVGDSHDQERLAFGKLAVEATRAGYGSPDGLYMKSGAIKKVYPISTTSDATTHIDELWLIVPRSNALDDVCTASGGSLPFVRSASAGTPMLTNCQGSIVAGDTLLVTNLSTASVVVAGSPSGSAPSISIPFGAPSGVTPNGLTVGDMVLRAEAVHYYVANDPTGHPALYRTTGALDDTTLSATPPKLFADANATNKTLVATDVEDFQVRFYMGNSTMNTSADVLYSNGSGTDPDAMPLDTQNTTVNVLRSMELGITTRTRVPLQNTNDTAQASRKADVSGDDFSPRPLFDHTPTATPDGFHRSQVIRRIALPNFQPGAL
jgi:type II secretory pathway pseudopilin PulG